MKKFVVLLVVVAMTLISSVALAEVTVGGEFAIRSRAFDNLDLDDAGADNALGKSHRDTQNRMKIDVSGKVGDVKGKIQVWNDWESWGDNNIGGFETQPGSTITNVTGTTAFQYEKNTIGIREAWVSFNLPGLPINVTGGHQLLMVGNGWFVRSMHYGSDAWVISAKAGNANFAFVDAKVSEGNAWNSDDTDLYVILGSIKLNDKMTVGVDLSNVVDRSGVAQTNLQNVGLNFNGKLGPLALKAEVDVQMGEIDNATGADPKFKGNQVVIQGSMPAGPVGVNFTLAQGSGQDTSTDITRYQTFLDVDPHYTFIYEYKINTVVGAKNTGFSNTTAIGLGATFAATKSLTIGADFWMLTATEPVAAKVGTGTSDDIGQEIDVKVNWKIAENLAWNWVYGIFKPGDAMGKDDATGLQGALVFKF